MNCYDCPFRCGADRDAGKIGVCGGGKYARIAKIINDFTFEEPCLGPLTAVFFGGCVLRCSYCQNYQISRGNSGKEYDDGMLAELFESAQNDLDLVTPSHYISAIERALKKTRKPLRIVYNTSGYETAEHVRRAGEFASVFLTDFKYADDTLAYQYSNARDYFETALAALERMRETSDEWNDGILTRGLVVRHLVLPGHVKNSIDVLDAIKSAVGTDTVLSLMSQFTPNGVGKPDIKLKKLEYKAVCEHAMKLGFRTGYFQRFESADTIYTPEF